MFGFCIDCYLFYPAPVKFDERKHVLGCPVCNKNISLDRSTKERLLAMSYREKHFSDQQATLRGN